METIDNIEIGEAKVEDAEVVLQYLNVIGGESNQLLFGKGEFTNSLQEEENFINQLNCSKTSIMLLAKMDNELIGIGIIHGNDKVRQQHVAEISLSIARNHWNKGIGSLMMENLLKFYKNNELLEILTLKVRRDNIYAIKLYERNGFRTICELINYVKIDDKYYDMFMMEITKTEQ